MPEVSFTTVVRKAQIWGGQTQSEQDGDGNILVCEFLTKPAADRMRNYAIEKGWHVPDEVSKGKGKKGKFYITILSPPLINYRALLKKYIIEGDNEERYDDDEWDALEEVATEIDQEVDETTSD